MGASEPSTPSGGAVGGLHQAPSSGGPSVGLSEPSIGATSPSMGSAPGVDVSGPAQPTGSAPSTGSAPDAPTAGVQGNFTGSASGGSGGGVDVDAGATTTGGAAQSVSSAQFAARGVAGQAEDPGSAADVQSTQNQVGNTGGAKVNMVASGDAGYMVQEETGAGSTDPNAAAQSQTSKVAIGARMSGMDAEDVAVEQSGYEDPVMKTAATKQKAQAKAAVVTGTADEVQGAANDPQTAAMMAGEGQAASTVAQHRPEAVVDAEADASTAGDVYADPEQAGVGQARQRVIGKLSETQGDADASTSVQANVGVSTSTEPEKK